MNTPALRILHALLYGLLLFTTEVQGSDSIDVGLVGPNSTRASDPLFCRSILEKVGSSKNPGGKVIHYISQKDRPPKKDVFPMKAELVRRVIACLSDEKTWGPWEPHLCEPDLYIELFDDSDARLSIAVGYKQHPSEACAKRSELDLHSFLDASKNAYLRGFAEETEKQANQPPLPTPAGDTPAANAAVAPPSMAAGL